MVCVINLTLMRSCSVYGCLLIYINVLEPLRLMHVQFGCNQNEHPLPTWNSIKHIYSYTDYNLCYLQIKCLHSFENHQILHCYQQLHVYRNRSTSLSAVFSFSQPKYQSRFLKLSLCEHSGLCYCGSAHFMSSGFAGWLGLERC